MIELRMTVRLSPTVQVAVVQIVSDDIGADATCKESVMRQMREKLAHEVLERLDKMGATNFEEQVTPYRMM